MWPGKLEFNLNDIFMRNRCGLIRFWSNSTGEINSATTQIHGPLVIVLICVFVCENENLTTAVLNKSKPGRFEHPKQMGVAWSPAVIKIPTSPPTPFALLHSSRNETDTGSQDRFLLISDYSAGWFSWPAQWPWKRCFLITRSCLSAWSWWGRITRGSSAGSWSTPPGPLLAWMPSTASCGFEPWWRSVALVLYNCSENSSVSD